MGNPARIIQLHVEKKKSFRIILMMEFLLMALGIVGLFGKNAVYEYGLSDMTTAFGEYSEESGSIYADGAVAFTDNLADFTDISLPRGTYRIQLHYVTDTDMLNHCYVTDAKLTDKLLQTNGASLFSGLDKTDYDMWLYRNADGITVHVEYGGEGFLSVNGLTIVQTNAMNRMWLFEIFCLASFINGIYLYAAYDRKYHIPVKNKTVTFCLGVTMLLAALPLIPDHTILAGDLGYHLMRVEGIKDGLLAGQFPIRISPEWQQGYGYASPIFYGETVLYIAALFRLIGFTVNTSCRLFMAVVVIATVLIAYECFKKIFQEAYVGVLCSLLYSVSVYRIYKTYYCGSWGECLGIMFLPLIVYGFYRVFTQDIHESSYQRSWIPLTAGFTLLIQSHLLTCEMVGGFTIVLCIILWKKVFRKETFLVLAKTVICSILLSAWFLIPFADYMLTGDFVIHHVSGRLIQDRGLFPAHLFLTFFINGGNVFFASNGMADSAAMGIGMALIVPLFLLLYLFFMGKARELTGYERGLGIIAGVFSVMAMVMSLSLFPWDRIQSLNRVTATLVSSIQFPNRLLTIANVCLTAVAGVVAKYVMMNKNTVYRKVYFTGMCFLVILGNVYLMDWGMNTFSPIRFYNNEGMGTGYISGAEYLPYGAQPEHFMYRPPMCEEGLEAYNYEKLSLGASAHMVNRNDQSAKAGFPLLYYKGYQAYATDSGERLDCYAGEDFTVTVNIPADFDGDISVRFVSPWHWRAGEAVTALSLIAMAATCAPGRKRERIRKRDTEKRAEEGMLS
ncbi:MAG: YfhO family protein [Lachnospiraceae bacterium]|nr:YfhO family protein [Butyrivibrio sp.]MCM1342747.1 YfhO family protein [Muribaculaceae bacterium]MCM1409989.1 YfhO family protein [Lachnospiraceae bacterium]